MCRTLDAKLLILIGFFSTSIDKINVNIQIEILFK